MLQNNNSLREEKAVQKSACDCFFPWEILHLIPPHLPYTAFLLEHLLKATILAASRKASLAPSLWVTVLGAGQLLRYKT